MFSVFEAYTIVDCKSKLYILQKNDDNGDNKKLKLS